MRRGKNPLVVFKPGLNAALRGFDCLSGLLELCVRHRRGFAGAFLTACVLSFGLYVVGTRFLPSVDSGESPLHLRAPRVAY